MLSINANYGFQSAIFYAHYTTTNRKHGLRLVLQKGQPKDLRLVYTNRNKNQLFWKTTKDISGLSDFRQELLENNMLYIISNIYMIDIPKNPDFSLE